MSKKAIYPGTFDPITNGHLDIISRASLLFSEVIVAIGENPEKMPLFSHRERIRLAKLAIGELGLQNVSVDSFSGLLVHYFEKIGANAIIRGLRAVSDFELEFQMALANRQLLPNAETIFLVPSEQFIYLSSSIVRTIAKNNGDISQFVPKVVEIALKKKFSGGHK